MTNKMLKGGAFLQATAYSYHTKSPGFIDINTFGFRPIRDNTTQAKYRKVRGYSTYYGSRSVYLDLMYETPEITYAGTGFRPIREFMITGKGCGAAIRAKDSHQVPQVRHTPESKSVYFGFRPIRNTDNLPKRLVGGGIGHPAKRSDLKCMPKTEFKDMGFRPIKEIT